MDGRDACVGREHVLYLVVHGGGHEAVSDVSLLVLDDLVDVRFGVEPPPHPVVSEVPADFLCFRERFVHERRVVVSAERAQEVVVAGRSDAGLLLE